MNITTKLALASGLLAVSVGCNKTTVCENGDEIDTSLGQACEESCDETFEEYDDGDLECQAYRDESDADCDDGEDNDGDGDVDMDDDDCIETVEYFQPEWFWAEGSFGYDAGADEIRPFVLDDAGTDVAVNPSVAITLAEEEYTTAYDDRYTCIVLLETAGNRSLGSWNGDAGTYIGFDLPADAAMQTDCDMVTMDPMIWGDDPVAAVTGWVWGVGIGPMPSDMRTQLKDLVDAEPSVDWQADFEPYVVGGGFYMNGLEGAPDFPGGFAFTSTANGWAANPDDNWKIIQEGGEDVRLLADDIEDGTVPNGAFSVRTFYILSGASTLAGG